MAKDFKTILDEAMAQVPRIMDKRQSGAAYIHLAPFAYELSLAYNDMEKVKDAVSIDTATDDILTRLCGQYGIERKAATRAQRKGTFNIEVPLESRFGVSKTTYRVVNRIEAFQYTLECEQYGEIGNVYSGDILPLAYIERLTSAVMMDIIIPGAEMEDDEHLRERFKQSITNPEQNGNVAQYLRWAMGYEGIGIARVFPLWNGGNTVKIAVTNRLYLPAENTLVNAFQEYIDPGSTGLGNGAAPIGAKITVSGGIAKKISVSAKIRLASGYTEPEGLNEDIAKYLASLVYKSDTVSYLRLGSAMLENKSILDMNDLLLNGGNTNIPLTGEEIPVLETVSVVVMP